MKKKKKKKEEEEGEKNRGRKKEGSAFSNYGIARPLYSSSDSSYFTDPLDSLFLSSLFFFLFFFLAQRYRRQLSRE